MMHVLRDTQGRLLAAMEYWTVNERGERDPRGRYIWVEQLELSSLPDGHAVIRRMIQEVAEQVPWFIGAYWKREDTTEQRLHGAPRHALLRHAREEVRSDGQGL